jgi:F-type H+-transporting ATPase subunit b
VAIDWKTFLFEIINFLVLVWLLHRFFYRPVLRAIDRRRAAIEQSLREAKAAQDQAAQLEQRYQTQIDQWEQEHRQARERLHQELEAERDRQLRALEHDLDQARERGRALERQREDSRVRAADQEAAALAQRFVTLLLQRLAGPELEARLVTLSLEDLRTLPDPQREALRQALEESRGAAAVDSAFELTAPQQQALTGALEGLVERKIACAFTTVPDLLAGLRITAGPWLLSANLREELKFFLEATHAGRPGGAAR